MSGLCCPQRFRDLIRQLLIRFSFFSSQTTTNTDTYRRSQTESMASSSMASSIPESTSSSVGDDSEYDHDEYRMTEEQKEYYTNQFLNLQSNLEDVIKGLCVCCFFILFSSFFFISPFIILIATIMDKHYGKNLTGGITSFTPTPNIPKYEENFFNYCRHVFFFYTRL